MSGMTMQWTQGNGMDAQATLRVVSPVITVQELLTKAQAAFEHGKMEVAANLAQEALHVYQGAATSLRPQDTMSMLSALGAMTSQLEEGNALQSQADRAAIAELIDEKAQVFDGLGIALGGVPATVGDLGAMERELASLLGQQPNAATTSPFMISHFTQNEVTAQSMAATAG